MNRVLAAAALVTAALALPATAHATKFCGGTFVTINGTAGPDTLVGTKGDDVIRAGKGDDRIVGKDGADTICAGPGDDSVESGTGSDRLRLGSGSDEALAGDDDDDIQGQGGDDHADGEAGTDGCFAEHVQGCEADVSSSATGSLPIYAGDQTVSTGTMSVSNIGPSPAEQTTGSGLLPAQAEFVASGSDPRCTEVATDQVNCFAETLDVNEVDHFAIAFRFPDCPTTPNQSVTFMGRADSGLTADPQPQNNVFQIAAPLTPAPSCP